jgi:predicted transposase/invertase (TIGR01784 family)
MDRVEECLVRTDALFYCLFQEMPACYFEAIGADAKMAEEYTFTSEELKQAGLRLDGVFLPKTKGKPVHFVEVYFYPKPNVYSNLFAKVFLWLDIKNPAQDWHATVFFESRKLEASALAAYRELLDSGRVTRVYLDELPTPKEIQVGLAIMNMIASSPNQAMETAKAVLGCIGDALRADADRRRVIELIETVIVGHFPDLSRKELAKMLKIKDFRETRVYQEGREEGREATREEIALRLLKKSLPTNEIASLTGLSAKQVEKLRKQISKRSG